MKKECVKYAEHEIHRTQRNLMSENHGITHKIDAEQFWSSF